jgi:hypothetical protein
MPIKPNFFIIGAPKSGTTAMSEYLSEHPQVFFSVPKELQYFAEDFQGRLIATEEAYLRLFQKANPEKQLALGEGSTIYLFSKIAVSKILEFQPDAKFIVMLRNPVELVQSFYFEMLDGGLENVDSFSEAWNMENERRLGKHVPRFCVDSKYLFYSEWGCLGTQLKRVISIAPKGSIKIILFDDFVQDTASTYREVLTFLGLPDDGRINFPRMNEKRYPRYILVPRLLGVILRLWLPIRSMIGFKGWGLSEFLKDWNSKRTKPAERDEVRAMLCRFYADEITLLEKLLDRDLSSWRGDAQ